MVLSPPVPLPPVPVPSPPSAGVIASGAAGGIGQQPIATGRARLGIATWRDDIHARVREAPGNRDHDRIRGARRVHIDLVGGGITGGDVVEGDAAGGAGIRIGHIVNGGQPRRCPRCPRWRSHRPRLPARSHRHRHCIGQSDNCSPLPPPQPCPRAGQRHRRGQTHPDDKADQQPGPVCSPHPLASRSLFPNP